MSTKIQPPLSWPFALGKCHSVPPVGNGARARLAESVDFASKFHANTAKEPDWDEFSLSPVLVNGL